MDSFPFISLPTPKPNGLNLRSLSSCSRGRRFRSSGISSGGGVGAVCYPWDPPATTPIFTRTSTRIGIATATTRITPILQQHSRQARGSRQRLPHPRLSIRFLPLPHLRTFLPLRAHDSTRCSQLPPLRRYRRNGSGWTLLGSSRNKDPGRRNFILLYQYPFENGHPRPYDPPHSAPAPPAPASSEAIDCICRYTVVNGFSVACDRCSRWCHGVCFGLTNSDKTRRSTFGGCRKGEPRSRRSSLREGRWEKSRWRWRGLWRWVGWMERRRLCREEEKGKSRDGAEEAGECCCFWGGNGDCWQFSCLRR